MSKLKTVEEVLDENKPVEKTFPYTALGMFKTNNMHKLAVFRYNDQGEVEFVEFQNLNADRNISRDMFKVNVINKGIIGT